MPFRSGADILEDLVPLADCHFVCPEAVANGLYSILLRAGRIDPLLEWLEGKASAACPSVDESRARKDTSFGLPVEVVPRASVGWASKQVLERARLALFQCR